MAVRASSRLDLLQGTLDMLILRAVRFAPQHGYGISQAIRAGSNEVLRVETGSLYPALHRLEKKGLIKAEWKLTEFNQRAKYYRVTAAGQKQLEAERTRWQQFSEAIANLMDAPEPTG
jgi:PadR family transcriptional regulator PadR